MRERAKLAGGMKQELDSVKDKRMKDSVEIRRFHQRREELLKPRTASVYQYASKVKRCRSRRRTNTEAGSRKTCACEDASYNSRKESTIHMVVCARRHSFTYMFLLSSGKKRTS